jgi:uncharacterized protein YndB with AHSA1/START domain
MSEHSQFVYVTFIRTTPEKLWDALIKPEFTRQYWGGFTQESEWRAGAAWSAKSPGGRVFDVGEIVEYDRPRKLVLTWAHQVDPDMKAEGPSRLTYTIEPAGEPKGVYVKLTLLHEMPRKDSKLIGAVSEGWPELMASLKTLLETGAALPGTDKFPDEA